MKIKLICLLFLVNGVVLAAPPRPETDWSSEQPTRPGLFDAASNMVTRLKEIDSERLKTLEGELALVCPLLLVSTNVIYRSSSAGECVEITDPDGLTSRLIRFATRPLGFRAGPRTPPSLNARYAHLGDRTFPGTKDSANDGELAAISQKNAQKRALLLFFLAENAGRMDGKLQNKWLAAVERIWILPPYYPDGGFARARIRREEDGIPSAEALLEWFAENENFCESVRADAKARLEKLKKMPTPKLDSSPVATTAPEKRKQNVQPVQEEDSLSQDETGGGSRE